MSECKHTSGVFGCSRCNAQCCWDCREPLPSDAIKTIGSRYCTNWRCERERDIESGALLALPKAIAMPDRVRLRSITVWRFHESPPELRQLSGHGGDEDWLALVPAVMRDERISWLEFGPFGVCDISEHKLADGSRVFIGAHA